MKKKFKLITTIASLCLAVALMAFGVYAATSVKYDIVTNVTYTATPNVKATVEYTLKVTNASATTLDGNNDNATKFDGTTKYEIWSDTVGTAENVDADEALGTVKLLQDLSKGDTVGTPMTFEYTVIFSNNAKEADANKTLKITMTHELSEENTYDTLGYKITVTPLTSDTLAMGTGNVTYKITLTVNPTASLPAEGINLNSHFELSMIA